MSKTAIRLLQPADHSALAALMVEMQGHYAVPCPPVEEIRAGLAALPAGVDILVAVKGEAVLGFASACNLYPGPGLKSGFFLKEIYVADAARGAGLGRALMKALAELAIERGHRRVDWTADAEDAPLLRFYEGLGAVAQTKKVFYRLTGEALIAVAKAAE
ncbi:GNAT family N-acetyltransferase [Bosea sp. F3-2]|jgi:GNAT superfamily N-acetyltransferase|uniref:GNAT family N-acetyltransferase n=1 Tax=Bosea sp. F3-2 TaxID=2599640 RepID=UPI0011EF1689|nr:GNAT family N-acetyltransferase [Bosea sp. F3-2]QEL22832.1 GNAT family N-acetyltransferase [Bosea sp. F3-2]